MQEDIPQVTIIKKSPNISKEIFEFIIYKNRITKMATDINNKLFLAGVNFWLASQKQTGEVYLMYDSHPSTWDLEKIKNELNLIQHQMYIMSGITFQ